ITAGSVVSSMFRLKDLDGEDGAFFVFNDVSVRTEGVFRLCFTLYEVTGLRVRRLLTTYSGDFTIFAPKRFPGLEESTALTRSFADQGLKIRARR
ncbi:velvet factor, partial [Catenaria anguillulae PL171]